MKKETLALLAIALIPAALYAADGQVLINQATVNAAGGFPYVITQPGSYKLSGNLIVTDKTKSAIVIASDFVTIDLGGFSIIGPNDCSSGVCTATGGGTGIETAVSRVFFNITIRNGTVQGMGFSGIRLVGDAFLVEYMHVRSHFGNGISLVRSALSGVPGQLATVEHCNVELNLNGIVVDGGQVNYNNSSRNRLGGIGLSHVGGSASITHNVVVENLGNGISGPFSAFIYSNNLLRNNVGGNVDGGINTGGNLCGSALCP